MITFRKLEKTIVGSVDGKPFNIVRTKENEKAIATMQAEKATAKEVLAFAKSTRSNEIAGSNEYLIYKPATGEYYLTMKGFRSKHAIPEELVKYIEESYSKDIDFMPVLKAWARLLTNPRYNQQMGQYFAKYLQATYLDIDERNKLMEEEDYSMEAANELATYQDISITQEGLLATYKVADMVTWEYIMEEQEDGTFKKVKNPRYKTIPAVLDSTTGEVLEEAKIVKPENLEEFLFTPSICKNGDKFYSGSRLGYVYKVGEVQSLPKNAKRNLNNTFGGGGLYSGGLEYISCYRHANAHVLTCFVDPADILSFQDEGRAFRTDALMPYNVWEEDEALRNIYHSSDYGKMSEERVKALIEDAVARDVDLADEQEEITSARENGTLDLIDPVKEDE